MTQKAVCSRLRCCIKHVGLICDRADLQPLLPQLFIDNFGTILERDMASLRRMCPGSLVLVRQKSAWNNDRLCTAILRRLVLALRAHLPASHSVLFLDAVGLHTTPFLASACHAARSWLWHFSPCENCIQLAMVDTHTCAPTIQPVLGTQRQGTRAELSVSQLLYSHDGMRRALQGRCWSGAFDENGFSTNHGSFQLFRCSCR